MKNLFFCLFLFAFQLNAQVDTTYLEGRISNYQTYVAAHGDSTELELHYISERCEIIRINPTIDDAGVFSIQAMLGSPRNALLSFGYGHPIDLFLFPMDTMNLDFEIQGIDDFGGESIVLTSLNLDGKHKEVNSVFRKYIDTFSRYPFQKDSIGASTLDTFVEEVNQVRHRLFEERHAFLTKEKAPQILLNFLDESLREEAALIYYGNISRDKPKGIQSFLLKKVRQPDNIWKNPYLCSETLSLMTRLSKIYGQDVYEFSLRYAFLNLEKDESLPLEARMYLRDSIIACKDADQKDQLARGFFDKYRAQYPEVIMASLYCGMLDSISSVDYNTNVEFMVYAVYHLASQREHFEVVKRVKPAVEKLLSDSMLLRLLHTDFIKLEKANSLSAEHIFPKEPLLDFLMHQNKKNFVLMLYQEDSKENAAYFNLLREVQLNVDKAADLKFVFLFLGGRYGYRTWMTEIHAANLTHGYHFKGSKYDSPLRGSVDDLGDEGIGIVLVGPHGTKLLKDPSNLPSIEAFFEMTEALK